MSADRLKSLNKCQIDASAQFVAACIFSNASHQSIYFFEFFFSPDFMKIIKIRCFPIDI
jgi:hypothetical protein